MAKVFEVKKGNETHYFTIKSICDIEESNGNYTLFLNVTNFAGIYKSFTIDKELAKEILIEMAKE